jgi:hypothetical protein
VANTKPFRLEVLIRLTKLLETVVMPAESPFAGGTVFTGKVYRGRILFGEETTVPFLCIMEPPVPEEQAQGPTGSDSTAGDWPLLIQGFVDDDKRNPTDPAHFLAAEVRKVLVKHRADNRTKGLLGFGDTDNVVEDFIVGAPVVRNSDDVSENAYFWLPITVKLVETLEDPLLYRETI